MRKMTTALFDFDGVIVNTEPLYDIFWGRIGEEYQLGIPDFPARIKGTTLQHIMDTFFSHLPAGGKDKIIALSEAYEQEMDFPVIPGAVDFLQALKSEGCKLGLVTSSASAKMSTALRKLGIGGVFDTVVTADRITHGKPHPMGYLLAASDLQARPEECVVFEDAFSGIQAGTSAGMRVIGLATTNPAAAIRDKVYAVVPDFADAGKVLSLMLK